jgi:porphobilinogen deaminase
MPEIEIGFLDPDNSESHIRELLVKKTEQWKSNFTEKEIHIKLSYVNNGDWSHHLLNGDKEIICLPLSFTDNSVPEELRIFALFSNDVKPRNIICSLHSYDQTEDLRLKKGSRIGVTDPVHAVQLRHLNPEINSFEVADYYNLKQKFESGELDAFLSKLNDENIENIKNSKVITLHPDEFIENTGYDKLVLTAHRESKKWMEILYPVFHDKNLTVCSNVERTICKHFDYLTSFVVKVRCKKDNKNFFHVKAALINKDTSTYFEHTISQSTHHRIAEKMIYMLSGFIKQSSKAE